MSAIPAFDCRGLEEMLDTSVECSVMCAVARLSVTTGHILNTVLGPDHQTDCNISGCTDSRCSCSLSPSALPMSVSATLVLGIRPKLRGVSVLPVLRGARGLTRSTLTSLVCPTGGTPPAPHT